MAPTKEGDDFAATTFGMPRVTRSCQLPTFRHCQRTTGLLRDLAMSGKKRTRTNPFVSVVALHLACRDDATLVPNRHRTIDGLIAKMSTSGRSENQGDV